MPNRVIPGARPLRANVSVHSNETVTTKKKVLTFKLEIMKTNIWLYPLALMGVLLMLSSSCKKNDDNPAPQVPVFTVTATTVQLQSGGEGLQFFGKCTNEDVKMTKVNLTSPISVETRTYNLNGNAIVKNSEFSLQDDNTAYFKELGTWNFTFEGNRTADNASFSVNATLPITVK